MLDICTSNDPLLRDVAPNLVPHNTFQADPYAVKMWTLEPGLRPSSGSGIDVLGRCFPAFARVSVLPLIAGKLVTNVSTGGGGTHPPVTPLPGDTRTNTHPLLLLLEKGQVHNTSMQFADTEPCAMCSWCVV